MKILAVFTGGDKGIAEALSGIKKLAGEQESLTALLSKSAERIIGKEKISETGVKEILIDDGRQNPYHLADLYDMLIMPVVTLNTLSKIANLVADNLISNLVVAFLRRRKPVLLCRDSIICCDVDVAPGEGLLKRAEDLVALVRELGIAVIEAKDTAFH